MKRTIATTGVWLLLIAVLTGCNPPQSPGASIGETHGSNETAEAQPTGEALSPTDLAPAKIPIITANDALLEPAQYQWFHEGAWDNNEVLDEADIVLTPVYLGENLSFSLSESNMPMEFIVGIYTTLDSRGIPIYEDGTKFDCMTSNICDVRVIDDRLEIDIPLSNEPQVIVAFASYVSRLPEKTAFTVVEPIISSVSWALKSHPR